MPLHPLVARSPVIEVGPLSLLKLAARFRPGWVHLFLLADGCTSLKDMQRAEVRLAARYPNYEVWEIENLLPKEIEVRRRQIESRRRHVLYDKILPVIRSTLASGQFRFTGTIASGERAEITPNLAETAQIDIENGTMSLPGGGPIWFGVTAEPVNTEPAQDVGEQMVNSVRGEMPTVLDETAPARSSARTWRLGDLCDMWAKASGRDRREILEQFAQDFFAGAFEMHGQAETLAESENERIASRSPIPVRVDDLLPHMAAAFRREGLSRAKAAKLSIKDWERMGEHGRLVLRLIEGLRLTQPAFHRWYRKAHLLERPPIWPANLGDDALVESATEAPQVSTALHNLEATAQLKGALQDAIHAAITAVYDYAAERDMKPPNVKEVVEPVQELLRRKGLAATATKIQELAAEVRHKQRRRPVGRRVYGSFLPFSALEM